MTRLQRALYPSRLLALIRRAAVPTMRDMVQVDIRVTLPISRELARRLRKGDYSKGPWQKLDGWYLTLSYPVKTCYPEHLPGFAREMLYAMRLAKREGKRLIIVRYK